jgi:hypothetical protein
MAQALGLRSPTPSTKCLQGRSTRCCSTNLTLQIAGSLLLSPFPFGVGCLMVGEGAQHEPKPAIVIEGNVAASTKWRDNR